MHISRIEGERCSLVPMSEMFLARHVELLQDPDVTRYLRLPVISVDGQRSWMLRILRSERDILHAIVVKKDDVHQYVGVAQLSNIDLRDGTASGGLVIADKNYWGQGIGREARDLHLRCAFEDLSLRWVYGRTAGGNVRAQRLMESLGYVRQGIRPQSRLVGEEFQDEILYGISRDTWRALHAT